MAASKQARIHIHFRNAVTLVWDSLRLAPIITNLQFRWYRARIYVGGRGV